MAERPTPDEVISLRQRVQSRYGLGITAAQDRCASRIHVTRRTWQQYESGDRGMHAAFWELAQIRLERSNAPADDSPASAG